MKADRAVSIEANGAMAPRVGREAVARFRRVLEGSRLAQGAMTEALQVITGHLCRIEAGAGGGQFASCDGGSDALTQTRDDSASPQVPVEASKLSPELYEKVKRLEPGKGAPVELNSREIKAILTKGVYGIIGAGKNPNEADWTPEKEAARHQAIIDECIAKGYRFVNARGKYGQEEASVFVFIPEVERDHLTELGKKLNQESVIFGHGTGHEMIFTNGPNEGKHHPGRGYKNLIDDPPDYFTEIKAKDGSYKFTLNFDFNKLVEWLMALVMEALLEKVEPRLSFGGLSSPPRVGLASGHGV